MTQITLILSTPDLPSTPVEQVGLSRAAPQAPSVHRSAPHRQNRFHGFGGRIAVRRGPAVAPSLATTRYPAGHCFPWRLDSPQTTVPTRHRSFDTLDTRRPLFRRNAVIEHRRGRWLRLRLAAGSIFSPFYRLYTVSSSTVS